MCPEDDKYHIAFFDGPNFSNSKFWMKVRFEDRDLMDCEERELENYPAEAIKRSKTEEIRTNVFESGRCHSSVEWKFLFRNFMLSKNLNNLISKRKSRL